MTTQPDDQYAQAVARSLHSLDCSGLRGYTALVTTTDPDSTIAFINVIDRMLSEVCERGTQIRFGIDPLGYGRADQTVNYGGTYESWSSNCLTSLWSNTGGKRPVCVSAMVSTVPARLRRLG